MGKLSDQLRDLGKHFEPGQPLAGLKPVYDFVYGVFFVTVRPTEKAPFIRDVINLKSIMALMLVALLPATFFGIYNVGFQIEVAKALPHHFLSAFLRGAGIVLPIILVSCFVAFFWEVVFACVRKRAISESFLVTGLLFALTLPPTIPLWQVVVGISFGMVVAREIFGGQGRNVVNPALAGRAFLFFAYSVQMSGAKIWVAVDGVTKATPLGLIAQAPTGIKAAEVLNNAGYVTSDFFWGFVPGAIGEASKFACLAGLVILLLMGIANWRIILGSLLGLLGTSTLVFMTHTGQAAYASETIVPYTHLLLGGFAFGVIFMAIDPVTSAATNLGRWIYGFLIGFLTVIFRSFSPGYAEGVMMAILLMNLFAPLIDYFVIEHHIKKRGARAKAK